MEQTPHKDVVISLEKDCTLLDALLLVEAAATEYVKSHGAEEIRQYFLQPGTEALLRFFQLYSPDFPKFDRARAGLLAAA